MSPISILLGVFVLLCERTEANPSRTSLHAWNRQDGFEYMPEGKNNIDWTRDTYVIIHGFSQSAGQCWISEAKNFLVDDNKNVLTVDWHFEASKSLEEVAGYTFDVGMEVGNVLIDLHTNNNLDYAKVTVVGFDFGAHVAGTAGRTVSELDGGAKIGTIIALNAAGPHFDSDVSNDVKLDPTDATYVQVLHTDDLGFGNSDLMGHVDFFPHYGYQQTGCLFYSDLYAACSHQRSILLFNASLTADRCTYTEVDCDTGASIPANTFVVGPYADPSITGKVCFDPTESEYPYC